MTDRKLNEALRSMLTGELVGELKRRGIFCVQGRLKDAIGTPFPKIINPRDKVVIIVARIP